MAQQDTEQEPSIEEILTSIRQIIADDEDEAPESGDSVPEYIPDEEAEEAERDVLELTNKIEDDFPDIPQDEPEKEEEFGAVGSDEPEEEIIVEMHEAEEEPEPEPAPPPPPKAQPKEVGRNMAEEEDSDSILTDSAENAAYKGFAELTKKTAVENGGITLEEIVRTELNPLLRQWLDKNLPNIIERLVREELERVAKRAAND